MEPWCGEGLSAVDPPGPSKYYRARYYDPKIGRFISEDPIGFAAGVNFYSYVENNPVNLTDPFGYSPGGAGCFMSYVVAGTIMGAAAPAAATAGVGIVLSPPGAAAGAAIGGLIGILICPGALPIPPPLCTSNRVPCYLIGSGGKGNAPGALQRCTYACDDGTQVNRYFQDCSQHPTISK
jgi:RHS repeat-associated protein